MEAGVKPHACPNYTLHATTGYDTTWVGKVEHVGQKLRGPHGPHKKAPQSYRNTPNGYFLEHVALSSRICLLQKKHSTIARGTQNKLEKTHLGQTLKNRFRGTVKFSIPVFYQNQTISKPNLAYRPPLGT